MTESLKNLSKNVGLRISADGMKKKEILKMMLIYSWMNTYLVILKNMSKLDLEKRVQFSDDFKLLGHPK